MIGDFLKKYQKNKNIDIFDNKPNPIDLGTYGVFDPTKWIPKEDEEETEKEVPFLKKYGIKVGAGVKVQNQTQTPTETQKDNLPTSQPQIYQETGSLSENIANQLKNKTFTPIEGKKIGTGETVSGIIATFGKMLTKVPQQVGVALLQAWQGKDGASVVNRDWADKYIKDASEDVQNFVEEAKLRYGNKSFMGLKISDLAELPQNMGYSLSSMGTGLAVGGAIASIPLPGFRNLAYLLGSAASGAVCYNATTYQIMQEYLEIKNQESIQAKGRGLTLEEENKLKQEFDRSAHYYGLWEALPEAISNLAFFNILTKPLTQITGKSVAIQIIRKLADLYGEEVATEAITQMGQSNIEIKAGLREEPLRSWTSPSDWIKSLKEVAPQTFLLTTIMAGAGSTIINTKEAFSKVENSLKKEVGENHPLYDKYLKSFEMQLQELGFTSDPAQSLAYQEPTEEPITEKETTKDIPKVLEPLVEEAKKYDSAEEFITRVGHGLEKSFEKDKPSHIIFERAFKSLSPEEQKKLFTRMPSRRVYDRWFRKTAIEDMATYSGAHLIMKEKPTTELLEEGEKYPVINVLNNNIPLSEAEFKYYQKIREQLTDFYNQAVAQQKEEKPITEEPTKAEMSEKEKEELSKKYGIPIEKIKKTIIPKDEKVIAALRQEPAITEEILQKLEQMVAQPQKPEESSIPEEIRQLPENLQKPVPEELKEEYLSIIAEEVKYSPDKNKLLNDVKKDTILSPNIITKYPNLMKKLDRLYEEKIKIPELRELEERKKPMVETIEKIHQPTIQEKTTPEIQEQPEVVEQPTIKNEPEIEQLTQDIAVEEKKTTPNIASEEQIAKIYRIAEKKALINEEGKMKPGFIKLKEAMVGKQKIDKLTGEQANKLINALDRLPEPRYDTKTGKIIPPSIPTSTKIVEADFYKRKFKEPSIDRYFTSPNYYAELLGVGSLLRPAEIGKLKLDLEFRKMVNEVEDVIKKLNENSRTSAREKLLSKLKNKPTAAEEKISLALNQYEESPDTLNSEELKVFDYFRSLYQSIWKRTNKVRAKLDLPPIQYRRAYFKHVADTEAEEILEGKRPLPLSIQSELDISELKIAPFPEGKKYWSSVGMSDKIFNPSELRRKISDKLLELWSRDLRTSTRSVLWYGLKEIHLSEPLKFFKEQLNALSKDIPVYRKLSPEEQEAYKNMQVLPASTKKYLIDIVNVLIKGQETELDSSLNRIITQTGLKGLFDKVLSPFGRAVGRKPITHMFEGIGKATIWSRMGWVPRQIIRNAFQPVQNMALYGVRATMKAFLPASIDNNLKTLLDKSLFLKTYSGIEDKAVGTFNKLEKIWLGPYGTVAVFNAANAMKASYWSTKELITNPKYKELGWADPDRIAKNYKVSNDYLYPSEQEKLLREMEWGAGCTQYQYTPLGMPEIFKHKALVPLTRLQSWWMNYFFKFNREAIFRAFKGETTYGAKLPLSYRVNYLKYLILGGAILMSLGYRRSFLIGVLPSYISPPGQLALGLYNYAVANTELQKKRALRQIYLCWTALIPGSLAWEDFVAVWNGEKDLKELFFYSSKQESGSVKYTSPYLKKYNITTHNSSTISKYSKDNSLKMGGYLKKYTNKR